VKPRSKQAFKIHKIYCVSDFCEKPLSWMQLVNLPMPRQSGGSGDIFQTDISPESYKHPMTQWLSKRNWISTGGGF
jgi:hypothetical protein